MKLITSYCLLVIIYLLSVSPVFAQEVDLRKEYAFGWVTSLSEALGVLVQPAFAIAGTTVVFYIIFAGAKLVFSGGNKSRLEEAQGMIKSAIIGFVLLLLMFVILQFVPEFLGLHGFQIIR